MSLNFAIDESPMAFFQHQNKKMHYDLVSGIVPEDTLFIHGNLASNNWWLPTMDILKARFKPSENQGRAAFAEWLGCGQSSGPESVDDLEMMSLARDYVALVKGLGLSDVNIVGHSTGGLISLCAMLIEPNLFRRAVLLDPVSAEGIPFGPEMYDAFTKMSQDKNFSDLVVAGTLYRTDLNSGLVQKLLNDAFNVNKKIWHGIPDVLKRVDIRQDLRKIQQPILVLHGEHDQLLPVAGSREIAAGVANGEFVEIKGQGHSCNIENPQKFVELMCEFLFER